MFVRFGVLSVLLTLITSGFGASIGSAKNSGELFPLAIIHINDFHARFEPTDSDGGTCDPGEECVGGYARTVYAVKHLLEERKDYNPVYFNAGDSFQGTLWYNIGRYNVTSEFLNMLPADAMTLGNHEFDHGIEGVVPFLETINTTMLVANMDASLEPSMVNKYQNSMIIERGNRKIGVIGVILETTYNLANTGKLIFRNESDTIREEAALLRDQGANIIIVISHCGYDVDQLIAKHAGADVDVIVGAHSHTFLFTGDNPPGPHKPRGDYPTEVIHESGHRVLIVQAMAYARYVGNITVFFDENGDVVEYSGAPLYMGADVPEDEEVKEALKPWKEHVDAQGNVVIGRSKVDLLKGPCSNGECNLGNFFCDAMVHAFVGLSPYNETAWTSAPIGLINTGALRVPLYRGNLTYAHMVTMSPFENVLTAFSLKGEHLLDALEYSVQPVDLENNITSSYIFLQVSGLKITFDFKRPYGKRVIAVKARCGDCDVPRYEDLDANKMYRIVAPNFLVNGGDGYHMFRDYGTDFQEEMTDIEALVDYTKSISPITTEQSIKAALIPWQEMLDEYGNRVLGSSRVYLQQKECARGECNLGNFFTDAMVHAFIGKTPYNSPYWSNTSIAMTTQGTFRVPLQKGNLNYNHLITMCPWENKLIALTLRGSILHELLENSVAPIKPEQAAPSSSRFFQVSGLRIVYNITEPIGSRVSCVKVRCQGNCDQPHYEDLDFNREYRIVFMEYLANGKNGFELIYENAKDIEFGSKDLDAFIDYMQSKEPIIAGIEGRITILK